jgi:hypothetical protein
MMQYETLGNTCSENATVRSHLLHCSMGARGAVYAPLRHRAADWLYLSPKRLRDKHLCVVVTTFLAVCANDAAARDSVPTEPSIVEVQQALAAGRDAAALLTVLAGYDPDDAATEPLKLQTPLDYTQFLYRDGLKGVHIAVMRQHAGFHDEVDTVFNRAIDTLRARGAIIVDPADIPTQGTLPRQPPHFPTSVP